MTTESSICRRPAGTRLCIVSCCTLTAVLIAASAASAHDTWVETNTSLVRAGDAVYIDLKLGNHGNDHRDFKLASKVSLESCTLDLIFPDGRKFDLLSELRDVGYAPNEGYWTAKFVPVGSGVYGIAHTVDKVVNHGRPMRSLKSGKAFFLASESLDKVLDLGEEWKKPLGHPLEIVLLSHPVRYVGKGFPIRVQVLLNGKPFAGARVSFIPQGETLAESFDEIYEQMTDESGLAKFTPKLSNRYLIVTHHKDDSLSGPNYEATSYSATLTLLVPELCACCE